MMQTCLLCGVLSPEVRMGLARYREPHEGLVFGAIPRCKDAFACRARVEASGDEWELDDGSRPTTKQHAAERIAVQHIDDVAIAPTDKSTDEESRWY